MYVQTVLMMLIITLIIVKIFCDFIHEERDVKRPQREQCNMLARAYWFFLPQRQTELLCIYHRSVSVIIFKETDAFS